MPYHLPVLSKPDFGLVRAPGPGFGNLLFPIARAVIGQAEVGGDLVLPTMRQIKLGTFLRGERDKRTYGDLFRHRSVPELHRWGLAHLHRHFGSSHRSPDQLFVYEGMGRQFHDLGANASLVERFLIQRSRLPPPTARYNLAIHIRLGDFAPADTMAPGQNTRLPLDWYRAAYEAARRRLGNGRIRGVVFSDEDPVELIKQLALDGCTPEPVGNALTSILALARADILIASRSTFSLWGRFLGDVPTIWPQGFDLAKYAPIDPERDSFL
jgi:hypothetical protein